MAEVTKELIFAGLEQLQEDLCGIDLTLAEVKAELSAIRGHMLATQQDIANIYAKLGRHEARFDRIERRLELRHLEPA